MDDSDWLALCVYEEARGESADGKAAVARVVLNRVADSYAADRTIESAITWPSQFSWCGYVWVRDHYEKLPGGLAAIRSRAEVMLARADSKAMTSCRGVAGLVQAGKYHGPLYDELTDDTVLYANLGMASPSWALHVPRVVTIGHHAFYRDPKAKRPGTTLPRPVANLPKQSGPILYSALPPLGAPDPAPNVDAGALAAAAGG